MNFSFIPKMLFGQPKAQEGKQCCVVSLCPSRMAIKLQVSKFVVVVLVVTDFYYCDCFVFI